MNLEEYLPIMLFLLVGIAVGGGAQLMGRLIGPYRPNEAKNTQYECGFDAFEDARVKFDVRYYLLAILFILFDLETVFFFPWAASMRELGWQGFVVMMIFVAEIAVVFWYLWKRGALDWE